MKWSQTLTFRILVVRRESINEFVLIWSIKVAFFLDILVGLVIVSIKYNIEVIPWHNIIFSLYKFVHFLSHVKWHGTLQTSVYRTTFLIEVRSQVWQIVDVDDRIINTNLNIMLLMTESPKVTVLTWNILFIALNFWTKIFFWLFRRISCI